ncbi:GTP-binding protein Di-Ras2-like protein [Dinothrombium tinctorium]|uniref:GTP-binding protein Di-Ras2-like protein n=1 Tax=Dinothrombium tinctorium TaxID=1965070 RepID=A0A443RMG5_9ACAR|nr:GTP-binding protein Di-Ras2-like protein [Dinothrombium tinctorium]
MPEQSNDYRVVVFGAGGVGKSRTFRDSYIPTIEDTYRQVISCNKNICTLQITDTTGSHQFPAMQRLNISKGHAFMLVYRLILEVKGNEESIPIILVGNKCDEESMREVKTDYAQDIVSKVFKGCGFMETSAKTNHNVKEAFQELLSLDKSRNMSLNLDLKKSRSQIRKEKLKGKCVLM